MPLCSFFPIKSGFTCLILYYTSELVTYSLRFHYGSAPENEKEMHIVLVLMCVQFSINCIIFIYMGVVIGLINNWFKNPPLKLTFAVSHIFSTAIFSILILLNLIDTLTTNYTPYLAMLQLGINSFGYGFQIIIFTSSFHIKPKNFNIRHPLDAEREGSKSQVVPVPNFIKQGSSLVCGLQFCFAIFILTFNVAIQIPQTSISLWLPFSQTQFENILVVFLCNSAIVQRSYFSRTCLPLSLFFKVCFWAPKGSDTESCFLYQALSNRAPPSTLKECNEYSFMYSRLNNRYRGFLDLKPPEEYRQFLRAPPISIVQEASHTFLE